MAQPKDFGYGEEQEMLKDSARRFMEDKQPLLALRESIKGTEDPYFGKNRTGSYDKAAWNDGRPWLDGSSRSRGSRRRRHELGYRDRCL